MLSQGYHLLYLLWVSRLIFFCVPNVWESGVSRQLGNLAGLNLRKVPAD